MFDAALARFTLHRELRILNCWSGFDFLGVGWMQRARLWKKEPEECAECSLEYLLAAGNIYVAGG